VKGQEPAKIGHQIVESNNKLRELTLDQTKGNLKIADGLRKQDVQRVMNPGLSKKSQSSYNLIETNDQFQGSSSATRNHQNTHRQWHGGQTARVDDCSEILELSEKSRSKSAASESPASYLLRSSRQSEKELIKKELLIKQNKKLNESFKIIVELLLHNARINDAIRSRIIEQATQSQIHIRNAFLKKKQRRQERVLRSKIRAQGITQATLYLEFEDDHQHEINPSNTSVELFGEFSQPNPWQVRVPCTYDPHFKCFKAESIQIKIGMSFKFIIKPHDKTNVIYVLSQRYKVISDDFGNFNNLYDPM